MIEEVRKILISWYRQNGRSLPWRETNDPYLIWLSEIILQQTRVSQGLPYYTSFVKTYPTVGDMAKASEQEVLRLWQGLGYYSRARNLHAAAKYVAYELNGVFPNTYLTLKELPGVGDYTASAIASAAFGEEKAVLDGNVFRVLSRLFLIRDDISANASRKVFSQMADELLDRNMPGTFNQAIMDFGALQCSPKPKCDTCPLEHLCMAKQDGCEATLPLKLKKIKRKHRYFHYFMIANTDGLYLKRRSEKDIWQGLFELPLIETESSKEPSFETVSKYFSGIQIKLEPLTFKKVHKLTHLDVHGLFYYVEPFAWRNTDAQFISWKDVNNYPLPRLIDEFLQNYRQPE